MSNTHVVLGASGVVGQETVQALIRSGHRPVAVSRNPVASQGSQPRAADLLDPTDAARALTGAEVAYLTVGLKYSAQVWAQQWPRILDNVVAAALQHDVHLVYLDNVYAYGLVDGPMREDAPIRPRSRKGEVRAAALRTLEDAAGRGLGVTIGRSADFYGPGATTSVVNPFVLDRISAGKPAIWLYDADQSHSLTYTPDIGRALALLGTTPSLQGRAWHLPTAPALTGRQVVELAAGGEHRVRTMGAVAMRFGGLFNPAAKETVEMSYQYARPYLFDSGAFEQATGMAATSMAAGIRACQVR